MSNSKAFCWCFTWNNPTLSGEELLELLTPITRFCIFQKEMGDEEGTEHYQGFAQTIKQMSRAALCKVQQMHWTVRYPKGSDKKAAAYCMKEDTRIEGPWQQGTFKEYGQGQGRRSDLARFAELARTSTHEEILSEMPDAFVKYHKSIAVIRSVKALDRPVVTDKREMILYYGRSDSGKTHTARALYPDHYVVPYTKGTLWFPNYQGQPVLVFEEFTGQIPFRQLLRITDKWPEQVEYKGGHMWMCAKTLLFCSNKHPDEWYKYAEKGHDKEALQRRFTECWEFFRERNPNPPYEVTRRWQEEMTWNDAMFY